MYLSKVKVDELMIDFNSSAWFLKEKENSWDLCSFPSSNF